MGSYQKLKIENKFLWWYISQIVEEYELDKDPSNPMKASEEAEKAKAWAKYQIKELQSNEKK